MTGTGIVVPALYVLAGICVSAGMSHLFVAARGPRRWSHLAFGLLCFLVAAYDLLGVAVYRSTSAEEYAAANKLFLFPLALAAPTYVWFVAAYTGYRSRRVIAAVLALCLTALVLHAVRPYGLFWESIRDPAEVRLPWGEVFRRPDASDGAWALLGYVQVLVLVAFAWRACAFQYERGHKRPALALGVSTGVLFAASVHDLLVDSGAVQFLYLTEYGFLGLIIVMSLNLSADVLEAATVKRELVARERDLRITLDSISDAVIATDAAGRITRTNPVAEELAEKTTAELRGRRLGEVFRLVDPQSRAPEPDPIARILAGSYGDATAVAESTLIRAHGEDRCLAGRGARIHDARGHVVGAVFVLRDVTRQRRLEEKLEHSRKMEVLGKIAGGVAHDFNNLLTGIVGYADLLVADLRDGKSRRRAQRVLEIGQRAADVARKLLVFNRKSQTVNRPVLIHALVDETVSILERSIDRRIHIERDLRAERDQVRGDPTHIQTALLNLGINARDAMPDGGTLRFETHDVYLDDDDCRDSAFELAPGAYVEIRVSDTGTGIPAGVVDQVFEPFFTTKAIGEGTGIGLTAVRETVQRHRGAIEVESGPERGTVFRLLLPGEVPTRAREVVPQPEPRMGYGTVLVIDDEEHVRTLADELLRELGYDVVVAADGPEGLAVAAELGERVDAVLLDMVMPKLSGREVLERLLELRGESVGVLLASGFVDDGSFDRLLEPPNVRFLAKPYRRAELARELDELMKSVDRSSARRPVEPAR